MYTLFFMPTYIFLLHSAIITLNSNHLVRIFTWIVPSHKFTKNSFRRHDTYIGYFIHKLLKNKVATRSRQKRRGPKPDCRRLSKALSVSVSSSCPSFHRPSKGNSAKLCLRVRWFALVWVFGLPWAIQKLSGCPNIKSGSHWPFLGKKYIYNW